MKDKDRYDVSDSIEAQFEPGSNDTVLKNKLGITEQGEMDKVEAEALIKATDTLFHEYDLDHQFNADDILHMHKVWLGDIYEWAGQYRKVNISKGDFHFSMVAQIPKLMTQLETEQLAKYTPCSFSERSEVIKALAVVHTELVLIHPFREGNGRCSRLLASIMALQAGLPVLDFSFISGLKKRIILPRYKLGWNATTNQWKNYLRKLLRARFRLCRSRMKVVAGNIRNLLAYRFNAGACFDGGRAGNTGNECIPVFCGIL